MKKFLLFFILFYISSPAQNSVEVEKEFQQFKSDFLFFLKPENCTIKNRDNKITIKLMHNENPKIQSFKETKIYEEGITKFLDSNKDQQRAIGYYYIGITKDYEKKELLLSRLKRTYEYTSEIYESLLLLDEKNYDTLFSEFADSSDTMILYSKHSTYLAKEKLIQILYKKLEDTDQKTKFFAMLLLLPHDSSNSAQVFNNNFNKIESTVLKKDILEAAGIVRLKGISQTLIPYLDDPELAQYTMIVFLSSKDTADYEIVYNKARVTKTANFLYPLFKSERKEAIKIGLEIIRKMQSDKEEDDYFKAGNGTLDESLADDIILTIKTTKNQYALEELMFPLSRIKYDKSVALINEILINGSDEMKYYLTKHFINGYLVRETDEKFEKDMILLDKIDKIYNEMRKNMLKKLRTNYSK